AVLRLTCRMSLRNVLSDVTVLTQASLDGSLSGPEEIPAKFEWVDALLFPSGLGLLLMKVGLRGPEPRLSQLMYLNQSLSTVLPPQVTSPMPTLQFASAVERMRVSDLINFLLQGLVRR